MGMSRVQERGVALIMGLVRKVQKVAMVELNFVHMSDPHRPFILMSDSESPFESESNAFNGELSNDQWDTNSEAVSLGAEGGEDTNVEIIGEGANFVPTHDIEKGLMTRQPIPLAVVYRDGSYAGVDQYCELQTGDTQVPDEHTSHQPETSTSGRGAAAVGHSSQPRMTEPELAKIRAEYLIPDSGVRLPLQPAVQKILAQIGYATGQYNPNFWVALMGVIAADDNSSMPAPPA
ncbi:unnamed protein product [Prunus armeniaca]